MSETYCRCYVKGMTACPIHGGRPPETFGDVRAALARIEAALAALKPTYVAVPVQTIGEWYGDWTKVRDAIVRAIESAELVDPDAQREFAAIVKGWHP